MENLDIYDGYEAPLKKIKLDTNSQASSYVNSGISIILPSISIF